MRLLSLTALAVGIGGAPAMAQQNASADVGPWLWAAPALHGFEGGVCADSLKPNAATMVDPIFCPLLGIEARRALGASFAKAVAARLPQVEGEFGGHLPAQATPEAKLRGTLAVSLRLTRANHAIVTKPAGVDAYLPVTLTLDITNPATGEVVFTRTRNSIAQGTYAAHAVEAELVRQFPAFLENSMQALVADAAAAFRPYSQTTRVLGSVTLGKGGIGYVVDKGRNAGLRVRDGINGDGTVLYAGPDYAIVQAQLERYHDGQQLSRVATAPVELLARPSVLTVMEGTPQGYSPAWLGQILEDALGSGSALAPVPVNAAFIGLRAMALNGAGTDLPQGQRSLPDYVASARVVLLDPVLRPSEIPGVTVERHEALAFVTLVDASGRAVGAWQGRGLIEDKVSGDIRLPLSQRRDAVLRNALLEVAHKMGEFRPQPRFLPLERKNGAMVLDDSSGAARAGETLQVLRPAGRFAGLASSVMIPVGVVTTREVTTDGLSVGDAGIEPLSLHGGEVVALETAGVPSTMRLSVGQCLGPDGKGAIEDRGQQLMAAFGSAAPSLLAGRMAAPVRLTTLTSALQKYEPSFADWQSFGPAQTRAVDACFVPVVSVVPEGAVYLVTAGYTLHRGPLASGPKIGSSGRTAKLTPTRLPNGAGADAISAMLQIDLASQVLPLAGISAATLKIAP